MGRAATGKSFVCYLTYGSWTTNRMDSLFQTVNRLVGNVDWGESHTVAACKFLGINRLQRISSCLYPLSSWAKSYFSFSLISFVYPWFMIEICIHSSSYYITSLSWKIFPKVLWFHYWRLARRSLEFWCMMDIFDLHLTCMLYHHLLTVSKKDGWESPNFSNTKGLWREIPILCHECEMVWSSFGEHHCFKDPTQAKNTFCGQKIVKKFGNMVNPISLIVWGDEPRESTKVH